MRALVAAVLLGGCYNPAYDDCAVSCATSNACPAGLQCVAGLCSSTGSCTNDDAGLGTWQFRKRGALGGANAALTDFPLAVRIPADPDLMNFAQPRGQDIKFTTIDGLPLAHEIERYDSATGELVAWVKFPTFPQLPTVEEFYMLYGNPMAPDQQDPQAVWNSDYLGVWHMNDGPGTSIADSTGKLPGTKSAAGTPSATTAGLLGGAQSFAGGTDLFDLGSPIELDSTNLTIEMWVNLKPNAAGYRSLAAFPTSFDNEIMVLYPGAALAQGDTKNLLVQVGAVSKFTTPSMSMKFDEWVHISITPGDGSAVMPPTVYIDDEKQAMTGLSATVGDQNTTVTFGGDAFAHRAADGLIDEVRISGVPRSQEWVGASVENQREGSLGISFGPAETNPN